MTSRMAQSRPTTAPPITAVNKVEKHFQIIVRNRRMNTADQKVEWSTRQQRENVSKEKREKAQKYWRLSSKSRPCGSRSATHIKKKKQKDRPSDRRRNPSMIDWANGGNNWPQITLETLWWAPSFPLSYSLFRYSEKNKKEARNKRRERSLSLSAPLLVLLCLINLPASIPGWAKKEAWRSSGL